jgi:hypothetical protein
MFARREVYLPIEKCSAVPIEKCSARVLDPRRFAPRTAQPFPYFDIFNLLFFPHSSFLDHDTW